MQSILSFEYGGIGSVNAIAHVLLVHGSYVGVAEFGDSIVSSRVIEGGCAGSGHKHRPYHLTNGR